jgi:hypothetical protein
VIRSSPTRVDLTDGLARAGGIGIALVLLLGFGFHFLWYRAVPEPAMQAFHERFFAGAFSGEWGHPEVPKPDDLPFWSVPAAFLAALCMSIALRGRLAISLICGGVLTLLLRFPIRPDQYGPPARGIHLIWFGAGAFGATLPPLWRQARVWRRRRRAGLGSS